MKEVPKEYVTSIMENLYLGYGQVDASIPQLGKSTVNVNVGDGNVFHMPTGSGEGSGQDMENQGKGSGEVTDNQENASAASKASGEGSGQDQSKSDPASSSPGAVVTGNQENASAATKAKTGTGLPETIGNRWRMPKPLHDHQEEIESGDHPASEEDKTPSLQERVEKLEVAVTSFMEVIQSHIKEGNFDTKQREKKGRQERDEVRRHKERMAGVSSPKGSAGTRAAEDATRASKVTARPVPGKG